MVIKLAVAVVMAAVVLTGLLAGHSSIYQAVSGGVYGGTGELSGQVTVIQPLLSTIGSSTELGSLVTLTGVLHSAAETPTCEKHPSCGLPSVVFSYLTSGGRNYRLLGLGIVEQLDGMNVTLTGWLHTPSSWEESNLYQPAVIFAGDITVTSLHVQG